MTIVRLGSPERPAWRHGRVLIATLPCDLGAWCFRCGDAPVERRRETHGWHRPHWYALLLLGVLPYLVAARFVRQPAVIELGLCRVHADQRRRARRVAVAMLAGAGLMLVAGAWSGAAWLALAVPFALVLTLLAWVTTRPLVQVSAVSGLMTWITNAPAEILGEVPEARMRTD